VFPDLPVPNSLAKKLAAFNSLAWIVPTRWPKIHAREFVLLGDIVALHFS
jgi:hypothetical protein